MKSVLLVALFLTAPAVAGCLATDETEDARPGAPGGAQVERLTDAATTCDDTTLLVFPEIERVQSLLPPGFTARDALGWPVVDRPPVPSSRGMVSITVLTCEDSALEGGPLGWAGNYILVEPPAVDTDAVDANGTPTYLAALYTTSPAHVAWAAPRGHDIALADVRNTVPAPVESGSATIHVADDEGIVAVVDGIVGGRVAFSAGQSSNWQVTDGGLLHHNVRVAERDFATGDAVSCSIRERSRMHEILGFTSCEGQLTSLFAGIDDPYEFAWTHVPGAKAGVVG